MTGMTGGDVQWRCGCVACHYYLTGLAGALQDVLLYIQFSLCMPPRTVL